MAVETLRAHPLRTALSTLGVVMGAGSLAAVLSIGDGAERFARSRIEREGMQVIVVQAKTADLIDGLRVPRTDYPVFGREDAAALAHDLASLATAGLIVEGAGLVQPGGNGRPAATRAVRVTAATLDGVPALAWTLAAGRFFTPAEEAEAARVVLVSAGLARALGHDRHTAVGTTLRLGTTDWQVVGVAEADETAPDALGAVVPFASRDAAMAATATPRLPELRVRAARIEHVREVRDRVRRWIAARGASFEAGTSLAATGEERLKQLAQGILVFKILMGAVTAISLLVGGIGIMNVLLASIADRTREIGVRKAVGASRRAVVLQFLTESVVIAGAGSLVGVALGTGGAFAVTAFARARTGALIYAGLTWSSLAASLGAAVLVGLAFGVYPALRAARLSPIDALRYE